MTSVYKVTLSAADQAALAAGGTLSVGIMVTPVAQPAPPPVVIPPPPAPLPVVGAGVIYADGVFHWLGDWSGSGTLMDYANKTLVPGKTVAAVTSLDPWAYWLPYCLHLATAPFTNLVLKIKPASPGQKFTAGAYTSTSTTADIMTGTTDTVQFASYQTGAADPDGVVTYTIPLAALKAANIDLYKIIVQDQSGQKGDVWGIEYAALV